MWNWLTVRRVVALDWCEEGRSLGRNSAKYQPDTGFWLVACLKMIGSPPYRVKRPSLTRVVVPERLAKRQSAKCLHSLFLTYSYPIFAVILPCRAGPRSELNGDRREKINK